MIDRALLVVGNEVGAGIGQFVGAKQPQILDQGEFWQQE